MDATRYRGARARTPAGRDDRADAAPGAAGAASPASPARGLAGRLLIAVVPALLGLITGGYHLGRVPLWRDEAATKAIASRRVIKILATMPHDDLVHGAYYLVVHYVIRLLGSSNHALRLPSVLAMAVACAFTALVAERLASAAGRSGAAWTGLTAGVIFALLPATIAYAQEARSYALVTMMATIATYLLLRALDDGRPGWWAGYGAAVFLAALFNLFGLLILVAHGLTLLALARPTTARHWVRRRLGAPPGWVAASAVAVALLIPVAIMAYGQRTSLGWISSPSLSREASALARLWAGSAGLVWPVFGLAALGVAASVITDRRAPGPATVALPWLAAPPAIMIAFSALHPIYDQRYVEFCLPALAICVASGIGWLWRLAGVALGRAAAPGRPGPPRLAGVAARLGGGRGAGGRPAASGRGGQVVQLSAGQPRARGRDHRGQRQAGRHRVLHPDQRPHRQHAVPQLVAEAARHRAGNVAGRLGHPVRHRRRPGRPAAAVHARHPGLGHLLGQRPGGRVPRHHRADGARPGGGPAGRGDAADPPLARRRHRSNALRRPLTRAPDRPRPHASLLRAALIARARCRPHPAISEHFLLLSCGEGRIGRVADDRWIAGYIGMYPAIHHDGRAPRFLLLSEMGGPSSGPRHTPGRDGLWAMAGGAAEEAARGWRPGRRGRKAGLADREVVGPADA